MSEEKNILAERYNISSNNFIKEKSEEKMYQTRTKKIEAIKSQKYKYKYYYNNTENQKIIKKKRNAANISSNEINNFTDENINTINIKNNRNNLNDNKYLIENSKNNIKENNYISNLKYQSKYFSKNSNINNANYSNIVNITSKYSSGVSNGVKFLKKNISENSKSNIYNSENISSKKLKANCETNYSINQITNVKYVNGTNKKISKNNYKRFPDIFFKSKEKSKEIMQSDNNDNIIKKDLSSECLCDINSKCICGKRKYNNEANYLDENNDLINYENHIKTINVEAYPVIFSDNDNSNLKSKKHKIIINRNNKDNFNIFKSLDNIRYERISNAKMNNTTELNNNLNICKHSENVKNYSSTKKNHIFKSICECSKKDIKLNMNTNTNTISSKFNEISNLKQNNIYINIKKGMNRSVSYENVKNKNSNKCSSEEYNNYILEKSNKSFDEEELRMQNIQNLNIIQDKKLYQILVPLQENKIDFQCGIEIIRKSQKKYTLEEIDEILKNEKSYNQSESLTSKKFSILMNNWNETNEVVNTNKISLENIKKENEDNLDKTIDKPKQFNIEAFSININDEGRRFKGEMFKENISIEYKNQIQNKIKSRNYNLSLSKNETISLNADYPRKDWNNLTKPIRGKNISFETSHKLVLIGENVERILIEGNEQSKKDWNIYNNEKKEVNINLCQSKKNKKLSKQRLKPLLIKGEENNNNFIPKENEPKVIINGFQIKNKKIEKNKDKDKENKLLINKDNNIIKENYNRTIVTNIKKVQEISEESISSEIDVLKNIKKYNKQINLNNGSGMDTAKINDKREIKVIINDISKKLPKKAETFRGEDNIENKEEQHAQIIKNQNIKNNISSEKVANVEQIQQNVKQINLYSKKIISNNNNNFQSNSKVIRQLEQNQEPIDQVRQYCDKENIKINSTNGQSLNNVKIYEKNNINNYNEKNQFLNDQTYNKEIKYKQETIENLTPIKSERPDDGIYKMNVNYSINLETNENIKKQNLGENVNNQKISISNETQNEKLNIKTAQFQPDYTHFNNIEQKIPSILNDEEDNKENFSNYNYNEMINVHNQAQPQIQYIYRKDINKKYIKQIIKNQEKHEEEKNINLINNINSQKNEINEYGKQFQIKQINYEVNYPEQEQENLLTLEESKHFINAQNQEVAQENYINIKNNDGIFNQLQEIESNNDINVNKYINNDEDITNYNFQQQLDISKTQELIEEPMSPSKNENENKYSDFIQGFSHHLKTTPSDNFNKFAINKLNIIQMKANSNDDNKNEYFSNMTENQ